jgi:hypothetical protein
VVVVVVVVVVVGVGVVGVGQGLDSQGTPSCQDPKQSPSKVLAQVPSG